MYPQSEMANSVRAEAHNALEQKRCFSDEPRIPVCDPQQSRYRPIDEVTQIPTPQRQPLPGDYGVGVRRAYGRTPYKNAKLRAKTGGFFPPELHD